MSRVICSHPKCRHVLTEKEMDYNLRIERRGPGRELCAWHGRKDFERKLAQVKRKQQQRVMAMH